MQLPLPLAWAAARGRADFLVSDANADAVRFLDAWATWPLPVALLIGPAGSGKTHLASIFTRRAYARLVDDAEAAEEEALFHAWNAAVAERRPLLLTARAAPRDWHVRLPDLASRLAATPSVTIARPDDALLRGVIAKQFRDRGLEAPPELLSYLAARIERSFAAAADIVARLDAAALAQRRPLTVPLARSVLEADAEPDLPIESPAVL